MPLKNLVDRAISWVEKADAALAAPRLMNTPKRRREAASARIEGRKLRRAGYALYGYAVSDIKPPKKSVLMEALSRKTTMDASYVLSESPDEWQNDDPDSQHIQEVFLRGLAQYDRDVRGQDAQDEAQRKAEERRRIKLESLENNIRSSRIDGFFPTPPSVIEEMLRGIDLANKTVFDPAAGMGHLLSAALSYGATKVHGWEIHPTLCSYANTANDDPAFTVAQGDFYELSADEPHAEYDVILMNPPYERNMSPLFVMHCLHMLKPGGTLAAVLPGNVLIKKEAKNKQLVRTLSDFKYWFRHLPSNSFAGSDSFNKTGVETSLLTVHMPEG